jgi:DNA-directed RNA polymerase specialized sigma24 family protein
MGRGDAFDRFRRAHRSSILHQTYAFAGDPETAQRATSDAFGQAARHRHTLVRDPDAGAWLRARAFRASDQDRNQGRRPWYVRAAEIDDAHRPLLLGLQDLSPSVRTIVILRYLVGLDLPAAAREAGVGDRQAGELLHRALGVLRRRVPDITEETLPARLGSLQDDVARMPMDPPSGMHRDGGGRRRTHVALAGLAALAALVAAGVLRAATPDHRTAATPESGGSRHVLAPLPRIGASQLLSLDQVAALDASATWRVRSTSSDSAGTAAIGGCLRFGATDPRAVHSWVRRFGSGRGEASQALQVSPTEAAARSAYRRVVVAYGRCTAPGRQLTAYDRLRRTGDRATLVGYRLVRRSATSSEIVVVAQTGLAVTSIVVDTTEPARPTAAAASRVMQRAVDNLCRDAHGRCSTVPPALSASMPPTSPTDGEFLSVVDLPGPTGGSGRWLATIPAATAENPAATLCDRTSFASTRHARTRSFVVAAAKGPADTFGLTETTGRLATRRAASHFVSHVHSVVSGCHHRQLSLVVTGTTPLGSRATGSDGYVWSVKARLSRNRSQRYLTAVIRVRRTVAQLTCTPTDTHPLSTGRFIRLVSRAERRLAR